MKKLQFILLTIACLSFTQYQFGFFDWFETAVSDVGNALEETFIEPFKKSGDNISNSASNVASSASNSANNLSNSVSNTAQNLQNTGQQISTHVEKIVDEAEKKINRIKATVSDNLGHIQTAVNSYIIPGVNKLSAAVDAHSITGNINVLKQSGAIIGQKIEHLKGNVPSIKIDNLASLDLNPFFAQVNSVYEAIQKPLQAATNVIHIMYTTLSYTSEISTHSGRVCNYTKYIADAFNFSPLTLAIDINQMVGSLGSLRNVLEITLPDTFRNVAGASQNMSTGFNNLYQNIGNTLQALQKQILALQKVAMSVQGLGDNIPGGPMPMQEVPEPPAPPAPPPVSLPTTINQSNHGTLPPPPPLPM